MAHRADGLSDIFEHNVLVRDSLTANNINTNSINVNGTIAQGSELLTDPSFNDSTKWSGTGWTISGGNAVHAGAPTGLSPTTNPIQTATTYKVTLVVVSAPNGGSVTLGGQTAINEPFAFLPGTYVGIVTTTNANNLVLTAQGNATFSNITLKKMYNTTLGNLQVENTFNVGTFQVQGQESSSSAAAYLKSGVANATLGTSGSVTIASGNCIAAGGTSGDVIIESGDTLSHIPVAGDVILRSSNSNNPGEIILDATSSVGGIGNVKLQGNVTIGDGTAGVDYTLTFDGETNNGVIAWMEDEDYFEFRDDLTFAGDNIGLPYGSCYGNDIGWSQATAAQNTWYNISDADMTDGELNLFTHDGSGKLTCTKGGRYLINYGLCASVSIANTHCEAGIEVSGSGSAVAAGQNHFELIGVNNEIPVSCTAILDLAAGATIEISIRTTDATTPTIEVQHLNITAVMVGGT